MSEHLLEVKHLKKSYPVYDNSGKLFAKKKHMCAVDDMSFFIEKVIFTLLAKTQFLIFAEKSDKRIFILS